MFIINNLYLHNFHDTAVAAKAPSGQGIYLTSENVVVTRRQIWWAIRKKFAEKVNALPLVVFCLDLRDLSSKNFLIKVIWMIFPATLAKIIKSDKPRIVTHDLL